MEIEKYKRLCTDDTIAITQHANRRFQERGIKIDDIEAAILNGEKFAIARRGKYR